MQEEHWSNMKERHRLEKSRKTVDCRQSGLAEGIGETKRRMNEFDLGEIFVKISETMRKEMESVVGKTPNEMQMVMKEGLKVMVKAVEDTMSQISDCVKQERKERKEMEQRISESAKQESEERKEMVQRISENVKQESEERKEMTQRSSESVKQERKERKEMEQRISQSVKQEAEVRKEMEQRTVVRMAKIEDKIQCGEAEVQRLKEQMVQMRQGERVRAMEGKVKSAMSEVKVMNINIGQVTENKETIVREAMGEVRRHTRREEVGYLNRILRRTRIVVLGKRTEGRKEGDRTEFTVPILFQCENRKDAQELEGLLRNAGYFPTFHWPGEIMGFIAKIREEVGNMGNVEQDSYIRIRPEDREGNIRIRADVKSKAGGRYMMKGIWMCPPLGHTLWEGVVGL